MFIENECNKRLWLCEQRRGRKKNWKEKDCKRFTVFSLHCFFKCLSFTLIVVVKGIHINTRHLFVIQVSILNWFWLLLSAGLNRSFNLIFFLLFACEFLIFNFIFIYCGSKKKRIEKKIEIGEAVYCQKDSW